MIIIKQSFIFSLQFMITLMQLNNCYGRRGLNWSEAFNEFETKPGTSYSFIGQSEIPTKVSNIEKLIANIPNIFDLEFQFIFPGTLWCGDGNRSKSVNELGTFENADSCCRQHDQCPFHIDKNQRFGLLKNNALFTRSACFCDRKFYECLENADDFISHKIGFTYFNILAPQCIGYDYPVIECVKSRRFFIEKCSTPKLDKSRNKTLQWFDNPHFY